MGSGRAVNRISFSLIIGKPLICLLLFDNREGARRQAVSCLKQDIGFDPVDEVILKPQQLGDKVATALLLI